MKGVILGGGLGTRLYPVSLATNKHLLPIYNKPMIYYPIESLVKANIKEILIVTGGVNAGDFLRVLKNGKDLNIEHLEYAYQEGEEGIPAALILAEQFANNSPIFVILGDNCIDCDLTPAINMFNEYIKVNPKPTCCIFTKHVPNVSAYGCIFRDQNNNIIDIIEKPKNVIEGEALLGLYIFDNVVFRIIPSLVKSSRNEFEIVDVIKWYLENGNILSYDVKDTFWMDAGSFDNMLIASNYYKEKALKENSNGIV